jgi:hypothetical protein
MIGSSHQGVVLERTSTTFLNSSNSMAESSGPSPCNKLRSTGLLRERYGS